jgi:hypothetical protein
VRGLHQRAGVIDLTPRADIGERPSHPADGFSATQQAADRKRLPHFAAGRMKIDRPLGILLLTEETLDPRGGTGIDLPFDRNPAVTARSAGIWRSNR